MTKHDFYQEHPKFHVAVDCIIFGFHEGKLHLLLLKRNFEPSRGLWSLMGGFVQQDESVDDAAKRVLKELTGLDNVFMKQVGAFGAIDRDPGKRVISVAYYALLLINDYDRERVESHHASWVEMSQLPPLIFDHQEMVAQARNRMKQEATFKPIGFNLLPERFTLTQLQKLYEAIYGEPIDKRNFRKRVAVMEFIEMTDEIDKVSSRRGARLFRMNKDRFRQGMTFGAPRRNRRNKKNE